MNERRDTPTTTVPSPEGRGEGVGPARGRAACPACGGPLFEVKAKLQCARCRTICETCCEGGRG